MSLIQNLSNYQFLQLVMLDLSAVCIKELYVLYNHDIWPVIEGKVEVH